MEQYFIYNTFIFEKRNIQISIFILFYFLAVGNFMPVLTSELPKQKPNNNKAHYSTEPFLTPCTSFFESLSNPNHLLICQMDNCWFD